MSDITNVSKQVNLKEKTILVLDHGLFFEVALKLADYYGKVYYFSPYQSAYPEMDLAVIGTEWKNGKQLSTFDGKNVERIENPYDYLDEIDIAYSTDVYYGSFIEMLEKAGIPCVGAGKGECLELDRYGTAKEMKQLGMDVANTVRIVGMDNLRKYLQENDNKWVKISRYRAEFETFHHNEYYLSEPLLDKLQMQLGALKNIVEFVVVDNVDAMVEEGVDTYTVNGMLPNVFSTGTEIKDVAYAMKLMKAEDLSIGNKVVNEKFSRLLKKYDYQGFFSTEVRTTKDKKHYFIDPCFSDDTDILTDKGWKKISDIVVGDTVATLNIATNKIEYQHPTDYIITPYEGKMIDITSPKKALECRVTPNHLVLRTDANGNGLYKEKAGELKGVGYIPRTGDWDGEQFDYFELPEYHKEWDFVGKNGNKIMTKVKHDEKVKINAVDFAAFMGWYLSEGSHDQYNVTITQYKYRDAVESVLKKLPFKYISSGKDFRICSKQLVSYLEEFGLCNEKFVPDFIKFGSKEVIQSFLDAFLLGDGSIHKGNRNYRTSSERMANDIQECIFKTGGLANIHFTKQKGTKMQFHKGGKEYIRNFDAYCVTELNQKKRFWFETGSRKDKYIKEVDYNGNVYCVTVPNGTVYVRRNGKPFWSSNCCREGLPSKFSYMELYDNFGEIVWGIGHGEIVNPKYKYEYGMEVLISSGWISGTHQSIYFPPEIRRWLKLLNPIKIDGKYHIIKTGESVSIGSLVAIGNSHEECARKIRKMAELIKGYEVNIKTDGIEEAIEAFNTMIKLSNKA